MSGCARTGCNNKRSQACELGYCATCCKAASPDPQCKVVAHKRSTEPAAAAAQADASSTTSTSTDYKMSGSSSGGIGAMSADQFVALLANALGRTSSAATVTAAHMQQLPPVSSTASTQQPRRQQQHLHQQQQQQQRGGIISELDSTIWGRTGQVARRTALLAAVDGLPSSSPSSLSSSLSPSSSSSSSSSSLSAPSASSGPLASSSSASLPTTTTDDADGDNDNSGGTTKDNSKQRIGAAMLRTCASYGGVSQWARMQQWRQQRNRNECLRIAEAVDALVLENDVALAVEILMRAIAGVHIADQTGKWGACSAIQWSPPIASLLPKDDFKRALKDNNVMASLTSSRPSSSAKSVWRGGRRGGRGGNRSGGRQQQNNNKYNNKNNRSARSSSSASAAAGDEADA